MEILHSELLWYDKFSMFPCLSRIIKYFWFSVCICFCLFFFCFLFFVFFVFFCLHWDVELTGYNFRKLLRFPRSVSSPHTMSAKKCALRAECSATLWSHITTRIYSWCNLTPSNSNTHCFYTLLKRERKLERIHILTPGPSRGIFADACIITTTTSRSPGCYAC